MCRRCSGTRGYMGSRYASKAGYTEKNQQHQKSKKSRVVIKRGHGQLKTHCHPDARRAGRYHSPAQMSPDTASRYLGVSPWVSQRESRECNSRLARQCRIPEWCSMLHTSGSLGLPIHQKTYAKSAPPPPCRVPLILKIV